MDARQPGDLRASFAHKAVAQFGEAKLAGNQCALVGAVGHRPRSAHHRADLFAARQPGAVEAGLDVDGKTVGGGKPDPSGGVSRAFPRAPLEAVPGHPVVVDAALTTARKRSLWGKGVVMKL